MEKSKSLKTILILLLSLIICGICIYHIIISFQWSEIWLVLKQANLPVFFLGSITTLISYWLLRTLRWYVLLRDENKSVSFFRLYLYTAVTVGLSTITPLQAGEALKVELLKKHDAARMSGYTNFAIERFLDILSILVFALIGLGVEFEDKFRSYIYLLLFGLILFGTTLFAIIFLFPHRWFDNLRHILKERLKVGILIQVIILTFVSWAVIAFGWQLALQSIGINLNLNQSVLILSLTTLVSILSFVPGAIGVSEISISQILVQIGYETSLAQAGALAIRGYALMVIVLTLIHLIMLKLKLPFTECKE